MSFQKYYYTYSLKKEKSIYKKILPIVLGCILGLLFMPAVVSTNLTVALLSPLAENSSHMALPQKNKYEVFGFAPHWTINKLDNVDFNVLTTLAYFGVGINTDGSMDQDAGYEVFYSDKATELFQKAHNHGTRVVLTITQMDNEEIKLFLDSPDAQEKAVKETVEMVKERGIDGVNIDFEYMGDPGDSYRNKFTAFVEKLTHHMHEEVPNSHVSVSVYASAVKDIKLYDIAAISKATDGIFMMAYDFATTGSDHVIPTAPLNGYKEGKYWYDISTAVDDFLAHMPAKKLILGLPWYGYNYPVSEPSVKAPKDTGYYTYYYWRGRRYSRFIGREGAAAQTYTLAKDNNPAEMEGWDEYGKVGWKAYKDAAGLWRMIFIDDKRSLAIKYDFAKEKNLGGVGMWALGFDNGKTELWTLLNSKFGVKLVDARLHKN